MKNKHYCIFSLVVFLVVSYVFINPSFEEPRSNYNSSQLRKLTTEDENSIRTDYIDDEGKITIAADIGYATIIISKTDTGTLERYYDDKGEPTNRNSGYYAVLHEYDENGNNIRNTFFDADGSLFSMPDGYSIETREYDDKKRIVKIRYFDQDNNPTNTYSYGYGRIHEYDEYGYNNKITFIDTSGNPMITKLGYASVYRTFYTSDNSQRGKIENEFYYDDKGYPVSLSLGQYGVHKEYDENGRNNIETYLDADGNPIISQKGYTTIKRTFHVDNTIATEQYYDINNQPYRLQEGQYGIKKNKDRSIYLNNKGTEIFNLRNLLQNKPRLVILIVLVFIFLSSFFKKQINFVFLVFILGAICYLTLFFRDKVTINSHLEPLWSYKQVFYNSEIRSEILKNIWLFIPLGAILYRIYPNKKVLFVCVILSISIEIMQYVSGKGLCEFDDLLSNSIGGYIGYIIGELTSDIKKRINSRKHIHIA